MVSPEIIFMNIYSDFMTLLTKYNLEHQKDQFILSTVINLRFYSLEKIVFSNFYISKSVRQLRQQKRFCTQNLLRESVKSCWLCLLIGRYYMTMLSIFELCTLQCSKNCPRSFARSSLVFSV